MESGFDVVSQVEIRDHGGTFVARADLQVKGTPVLVEFDGRAKFSISEDVESAHWAAKLRRDALQELGFEVHTVVWADLDTPANLIARLERVLRRVGVDPRAVRHRQQ